MFYGRRRKISAEETEANRQAKLARERATMTCQCCGRKHLANRGWIAHHGYLRPGHGYQTRSCGGAKYLPFEVNRDRLGILIADLKEFRVHCETFLGKRCRDEIDLVLRYSFRDRHVGGWATKGVLRDVTFVVTRETFDAVRGAEDNAEIFRSHSWNDFEICKDYDIYARRREIENLTRDINDQTKRYNGWKQTHVWNGFGWGEVP